MSDLLGEKPKTGLAAKIPDILGVIGSLIVLSLAVLIYLNKLPALYRYLFQYFYIFAIIGIIGFLGEAASITILIFLLPVALVGSTLALKFRPERFPLEEWWDTYALLVVFATGLIIYLFLRWEQTKKLKGAEDGNLNVRVDPLAAARYREEEMKKAAAKELKVEGLKDPVVDKVARSKKPEVAAEPIDPTETAGQRMERETRQIKEEFGKKSMRMSTTLLRMKNLSKSLDRDEIFKAIVEIIAKGMDADKVQLLLNDEKEKKLIVVRAEGMAPKDYKDLAISHDESSIIGYLARQGGPNAIEGGALGVKECKIDPKTSGLIDHGIIKSIIAAPIWLEKSVFGVINVEKMKNPDYTRDDVNLLATCADVGGLVMKNAKLYSATIDDLVSTKKISEEQLRKNEELKGSLSRIVSPSVAELIMKDPSGLKLGGSKTQVTVFFSDIRGFTKMSESMDPTDIVAQLNVYFTRMTDILMELDGTLDKYVGDELMALFGAPVSRPDDPLRAVLCGVRMLQALRELQDVWRKEKKPVIQIGLGINTGEVTAGYMGSEKQLSYTVIGDNVNLAARVMANAKPMQLLITRATYDHVRDHFDATPLEPIMVKGKSMPIEIFLVNGVKGEGNLNNLVESTRQLGAVVTVGQTSPVRTSSAPLNLTGDQMKQNIQIDNKPKVIECRNCGEVNDAQTKFCGKCGMPIF